jgi:acyl dehydratase
MARNCSVNDTFSLVRTCDRYRPIYYAAASGDFNPIHLDAEVAKDAKLGGTILQGLCTLGWAVEAFINYLGDPGLVSRVRVRFSKPVALEDTITYSGTVVAIEAGLVRAEVSAKNQRGDDVLKGAVLEARLQPAAPVVQCEAPSEQAVAAPKPASAGGLDPAHVGRRYGPFTYQAGLEKMREFAFAVGGSVPSMGFSAVGAPATLHPWLFDEAAARASPWGSVIAMPNFAVVYAIGPFGKACVDPEVGVNLLLLVHGEQEFEFFAPVKSGDVLTTVGSISDIRSKAGLDFLSVVSQSHNQRNELVTRAKWTAVIRRA